VVPVRRPLRTVAAAALVVLAATACGESTNTPAGAGGTAGDGNAPVGVDFPRADSDFWNSYIKYVPQYAKELSVNMMSPTNSQNKVETLVANVQTLQSQGAKAIVMAPQDTGAIATTLQRLEQQ
jgi:ribose transport system substrate-binding protein